MQVALVVASLLASLANAGYECTESTIVNKTLPKTDYLFLVDKSGSMGSSITGVMSGLNAFAQKVNASEQDYQFSYVVFGGKPQIRVPFTKDITLLQTAMTADAARPNAGGQEASFEAMRMVLGNDAALLKSCAAGMSCTLNWRQGATKVIIHATDEDSDLPNIAANREPDQASIVNTFCNKLYKPSVVECINTNVLFEPGFTGATLDFVPQLSGGKWVSDTTKRNFYRNQTNFELTAPYEAELKKTADSLIAQGVIVNSLISLKVGSNDFDSTIELPISSFNPTSKYFKYMKQTNPNLVGDTNTVARYQFGDPTLQVQNAQNYSGFDASSTLSILQNAGLGNSLQARMLAGNGFMRIFDIAVFANGVNQDLVNAFYEQMIKTTVTVQQKCVFVPDPVTSSSSTSSASATAAASATASESATATSETASATATESTSASAEPTYTVPDVPAEVPENQQENDSAAEVVLPPVQTDVVEESSAPEVVAPTEDNSAPQPTPVEHDGSDPNLVVNPVETVFPGQPEPETPQESQKPGPAPNMTPVAVAVPLAAVAGAAALFMFYRKRSQVVKTARIDEDSFENSLSNNPLYNQLGVSRDNPLFQSVASINSPKASDFAISNV